MKVIQLVPELESGGVERGTLELGQFLAARGHESLVVSHGGRLVGRLEQEGSRHLRLPVHRKSPFSLRMVPKLCALFREEQPAIVHARSRVPAWLAFLAWRRMAPDSRPHFVTTVHGFNSVNSYSRIMTRGERVICVSHSIRQFVRDHYPSCRPEHLVVIHRGIEPTDYPRGHQPSQEWREAWFREFPETRGKRLLVLPGRMTRLKGHRDFFDLLSDLLPDDPDLHGLIVGDAPPHKTGYQRELEARLEELRLASHVTMTGHRSDLREVLALSELSFSLTQQPESFGRTVLESLAIGTPVIGYDHGGVAEVLEVLLPDGAIPPRDPRALVDRTRQFLASPPAIGTDHPFTLQRMLEKTVAVYEDLMTG